MSSRPGEESFALNGLNALLTTAAQNSPDSLLVEDDDGSTTAAQLNRRAGQLAAQLRLGGLTRGERVLIVAGAQTAALVAIAAVLRAGFEPVMAPCDVNPVELATFARISDAAALIGPSHYGALDLTDVYLSAAAIAETVRGILTHGPGLVDGAVDISFAALDALPAQDESGSAILEMPTIATFDGPKLAPRLISHRQAALFADALSLVEQARIAPSRRIVSLLPPTSLAGLVGGPFAAFVGASHLVLHGPFAARRFLHHCDQADSTAERSFHLLAPAAIGAAFENESLTVDLASLLLVSRFADHDAFALPASIACRCPVIDLYAFGEGTVLAQTRQNGEADPPRRLTELSLTDGLGARLNRARAEQRFQGADALP